MKTGFAGFGRCEPLTHWKFTHPHYYQARIPVSESRGSRQQFQSKGLVMRITVYGFVVGFGRLWCAVISRRSQTAGCLAARNRFLKRSPHKFLPSERRVRFRERRFASFYNCYKELHSLGVGGRTERIAGDASRAVIDGAGYALNASTALYCHHFVPPGMRVGDRNRPASMEHEMPAAFDMDLDRNKSVPPATSHLVMDADWRESLATVRPAGPPTR